MIDLYTWATPNGRKVSILLEELGVPYTVKPIDIGKDEQFAPDFLRVAPNNRIPAIVDHETGQTLMETGAIMLYLGHKHSRFIGDDEVGGEAYWRVVEWLMWQMGGVGPMLGQVHHFVKYNPGKSAYAEERYSTEARRLYRVLNTRLEGRDYVADRYSIADMAIWPWISRFEWQQIDLDAYPNVRDWYLRLAERPAVQRGYQIPHYVTDIPMPTRTTP
jgi:GSH-dependent disulfide-bond oxidoreductase